MPNIFYKSHAYNKVFFYNLNKSAFPLPLIHMGHIASRISWAVAR
jgi:hypothetical protein